MECIDLSADYYDLAVKHLDLQAKRRDNLAEHKVLTFENINLLAKHYDFRILQAEKKLFNTACFDESSLRQTAETLYRTKIFCLMD